jgi:hypothetical protein
MRDYHDTYWKVINIRTWIIICIWTFCNNSMRNNNFFNEWNLFDRSFWIWPHLMNECCLLPLDAFYATNEERNNIQIMNNERRQTTLRLWFPFILSYEKSIAKLWTSIEYIHREWNEWVSEGYMNKGRNVRQLINEHSTPFHDHGTFEFISITAGKCWHCNEY